MCGPTTVKRSMVGTAVGEAGPSTALRSGRMTRLWGGLVGGFCDSGNAGECGARARSVRGGAFSGVDDEGGDGPPGGGETQPELLLDGPKNGRAGGRRGGWGEIAAKTAFHRSPCPIEVVPSVEASSRRRDDRWELFGDDLDEEAVG